VPESRAPTGSDPGGADPPPPPAATFFPPPPGRARPTAARRCARGSATPLQPFLLCATIMSAYRGFLQMGEWKLLETI
jgi:hypothetical protein